MPRDTLHADWQITHKVLEDVRSIWNDERGRMLFQRHLDPLAESAQDIISAVTRHADVLQKSTTLQASLTEDIARLEGIVRMCRQHLRKTDDLADQVLAQCDDVLVRAAEAGRVIERVNELLSRANEITF